MDFKKILKEIVDEIIFFLFKKYAKPKIVGEITNTEIKEIIEESFPRATIYLSDKKYQLTSVDEIKKFLAVDATSDKKYKKRYHDCDNFSYRLIGQMQDWCANLAFGIIWVTGKGFAHGLNCFIDDKKEFWLIEPQSDRIYKPPKKYMGWLVVI